MTSFSRDIQKETICIQIPRVNIDSLGLNDNKKILDYVHKKIIPIKEKLEAKKNELDKYYLNPATSKKYDEIANILRPTKMLSWILVDKYNGQFPSRAWIKFMELYKYFKIENLINKENPTLTVFLNAELPGAAISALNHYVQTELKEKYRNLKFKWYASSLVPNFILNNLKNKNKEDLNNKISDKNIETALGDIYGIWKNNPSNWLMTVNQKSDKLKSDKTKSNYINNGDTTVVENLLDYQQRIEKVDLYTHDAGISVTDVMEKNNDKTEFNMQELFNAKIHYGCLLAAVLTMKSGATYIGKQYTLFETITIDLILIYTNLFEKFYLCKPMSSGPANSETYLIGVKFIPPNDALKSFLIDKLRHFDISPIFEKNRVIQSEEAQKAIDKIVEFNRILCEQQVKFLDESIRLFEKFKDNSKKLKYEIRPSSEKFANKWLEKFPVKKIDKKNHLLSNKN